MVIYDKEYDNVVVLGNYPMEILMIDFYADTMDFTFMCRKADKFYHDNIKFLQRDVYEHRSLADCEVHTKDIEELISIIKENLKTHHVYDLPSERYSSICVKPSEYEEDVIRIYIQANDNITPSDAEFLANKLFEIEYNYCEVEALLESWQQNLLNDA